MKRLYTGGYIGLTVLLTMTIVNTVTPFLNRDAEFIALILFTSLITLTVINYLITIIAGFDSKKVEPISDMVVLIIVVLVWVVLFIFSYYFVISTYN